MVKPLREREVGGQMLGDSQPWGENSDLGSSGFIFAEVGVCQDESNHCVDNALYVFQPG
jgi:hypothetical protein